MAARCQGKTFSMLHDREASPNAFQAFGRFAIGDLKAQSPDGRPNFGIENLLNA
jgi:hypothetical protein